MSITTGKFFSCILVGIAPTVVGRAIDHKPQTAADWSKAVAADIADGTTVEVPGVVKQAQDLMSNYPAIFNALLTQVYVPDGTGGYAPVPVAKVLKDQIAVLGNTPGVLNVLWPTPPHPAGQDLANLINQLSKYDETQPAPPPTE